MVDYKSFFERFCEKEEFLDRKELSNENAIDVIIPIKNTNYLFEKNIYSYYRVIPINRILIGDSGSTDDSLEILKKFPRVKIINQSQYKTLGKCIAELISLVETEWFVYLHADVYLPENWFEIMKKYQSKFDWFECNRSYVAMVEYFNKNLKNTARALSGSQMGRKKAFENIIPKIEDDYLYRNEDIIFHELIEDSGFKYGRIFDTYHYHQILNKKGVKEPEITKVTIHKPISKQYITDTYTMQAKGIIKHLKPKKKYLIRNVNLALRILRENDALDSKKFKAWVYKTNKVWLKFIKVEDPLYIKILDKIRFIFKKIFK